MTELTGLDVRSTPSAELAVPDVSSWEQPLRSWSDRFSHLDPLSRDVREWGEASVVNLLNPRGQRQDARRTYGLTKHRTVVRLNSAR